MVNNQAYFPPATIALLTIVKPLLMYPLLSPAATHTLLTAPIKLVLIALFSIPYKINFPYNVTCVFGILNIISHTHIILTIQDNQRSFLWNYIWILVQQFIN